MDEVIDIAIAPGASLSELNFVVDAFKNTVGQTGFDEVDNAAPMRNDRFGEGLEGRNFGGIDFGAPLRQKGMSARFIRHVPEVVEDGFQSVGFAQRGIQPNQFGQLLLLTVRQLIGILQESVFMPFQSVMFFTFGFTHVVYGFIDLKADRQLKVKMTSG